jgi:hypothetical protein
MRLRAAVLLAVAVLALPAGASASLAGEQRDGQALLAAVRDGSRTCADLSPQDLDHLGEYAMGRALGDPALHQAMNDRMRTALGAQAETRMHQALGARLAGCATAAGGGMMGGAGAWGPMMGSRDFRWMTGTGWQAMNREDWLRLQRQLVGTPSTTGGGLSALAIVAIATGGAALLAAGAFAVGRRHAGRGLARS